MKFDATYCGAVMQGQNVPVYEIRKDGKFASAWVEDSVTRVTLTGYTSVSPMGNTHYQTTSGEWIYLPDGWSKVGTQAINNYSQAMAQAQVNKIIRNNILILQNNLVCARYASKLTYEQQAQVRELQSRLESRNEALQAGGLTSDIETSYPSGYAELSLYLDRLMAGEAIGMATWVVVVIAATVLAATATAAYFAYKTLADESERDVKFSKELTTILTSKLTEEEYAQLKNETKGIVTKARIKQLLGDWGSVASVVGIAIGGVLLYRWLKKII